MSDLITRGVEKGLRMTDQRKVVARVIARRQGVAEVLWQAAARP